jgi:hypothetical protein
VKPSQISVKFKNSKLVEKLKTIVAKPLWHEKYDGVRFMNEHFNFEEDVNKTKKMGLARASKLMVMYELRYLLLGKVLREEFVIVVATSNVKNGQTSNS